MKFLPEVRFPVSFLNILKKVEREVKDKNLVQDVKNEYIIASRRGIIDKLTGLYNRRKFDEDLSHLYSQVDVEKNVHLSMLLIDIDNFKSINDKFGHDRGDTVLRWVATTIKKSLRDRPGFRESGRVYRYGGEEFAVLLPNTSPDTAFLVAERIRKHISVESNKSITVSIGTSNSSDKKCKSSNSIVRSSDKALYRAKTTGKNKIIINDNDDNNVE